MDNSFTQLADFSADRQELLEILLQEEADDVLTFPLSSAQQRLWFLDQLEPGSAAYHIPAAVRLRGELNLTALQKTLNEIVRRHEVLRTRFVTVAGEPQQVIEAEYELALPLTDLSGIAAEERVAAVERVVLEEAQAAFDLERGPLVRVRLVREGAEEHVLVVVMHHIISDGWSMGVLVREVGALYAAYATGAESPLAELELQYGDYAVWQREQLQGERLAEQLEYWRGQLQGAAVLELPADRARGAVAGDAGAQVAMELPASLTKALQELSRREGVTLFMVLVAAFKVLLARWSGQRDVVVGTPVAGRTRVELEPLLGFFVNTLALRTQLGERSSFRELLQQVREVALGAYAHQETPFELLVEALSPERQLSHTPLFQVMFVFQEAPPELQLPGLTLSRMKASSGTSKFDLLISFEESAKGLAGTLEYSTDLFDEATMRRFVEHYETLLNGIVANPDQCISTFPLLTAQEQEQLIEWNRNAAEYPRELCITELFEQQVRRTPHNIAATFEGEQLSYTELDHRANQLAHTVRKLGVGADSVVGICVERSLDMVVCVLGVLKAGGAYLPLDTAYPRERLAFMIENAQALVVLTQQRFVAQVSGKGNARVINIDEHRQAIALESTNSPAQDATPESLAYVIYTSGSTGMPKAVAMPHRPLVNLIAFQAQRSGEVGLRTLQFSSLSFDVSFQEIFSTWCTGGTLVLVREETRRDARELWQVLSEEGVERLFLPFVALNHLAEVVAAESVVPDSLRQVITAGEQLKITSSIGGMFEKLGECTLDNQYGPSETHVASAFLLEGLASDWPELPPIGRPIANSQLYVLDEYMQLVPVGVTGELYIGGDCVARGYLGRPQLSAEKFVPHPFSDAPGARLYRTGDAARYLPNGEIEFIGRLDHQVKIRGYRIEPGEIEVLLSQHEAISSAVVVAQDAGVQKRLVAYVVGHETEQVNISALRDYLKERLPDYMIPAVFMPLERLPLTPNGKVDRRALPVPDLAGSVDDEDFVQPRTPVEEILCGIWSEVLRRGPLSVHDNFFELGGHSLLATQMMSRVRSVFDVDIPLRRLFESPSVAGLAKVIEQGIGQASREVRIVPVRRDVNLPLSFSQQRLWFLDQLEPGSAAYHIPAAVRLKGELNIAALQKTLNEIVRRHEVLRTRFVTVQGEPQQVIEAEYELALPLTDLSEIAAEQRVAAVERVVLEEAQAAFDLEHGPLVRVRLVRESAEEHVLVVVMHHIISDGWSMGVLVREVGALYAAYATGAESPLAELELQYGDYAVWQREQLQGERLAQQLEYWRGQLQGAAVLELPADRVRGTVAGDAGAQMAMELPASLTKALQELSRREGVTLFMVLVAAFKVLLARWSGQRDVVVGTPVAGRTRVELEPLLGFFVNTLALRTQIGERSSFRELLQQVREVALGAYAHQETPFELLVEALSPERQLSHTPLFQVLFALQNAPQAELQLGGVELVVEGLSSATAKFDLTLALEEQGGVLRGQWEYRTELFEAETIERLARHYETLLQSVVAAPEQEVWTLPMLPAEEREQVVVGWNETQRAYPAETSVAELFEEQAERRPEAVALEQGEERITYRELNERANQLAHYLKRLGVGQEVRVGLCLERSVEMVVGLLGILKAGGVYVPLDRQYPEARLQFMLEDTQAQVLLTRERLVADLPVSGISLVCLDRDAELIAAEPVTNPPVSVFAENLAYVIYTSGSTGRPKGVAITHGSAVTLIHWAQEKFTTAELAVVLASTSICFDLSVFELFVPLSVGGTVLLVENALELPNLERRAEVTLINTVPSVMTELLRMGALPESVRVVNLAGEPLQAALVEQVYAAGAVQRVLNLYGPSEDTTYSTWSVVERGEQPNIGRPVANTQVYILDQAQQVVPVGVTGELYIGGAGLARGYLNRAELTAEKFVPDPFSGEGGARLYRTGDVGRYRRDGEIEYLGRADQQVKLRGFRIELGEIEAVLSQHESVAEVAVVAHSGTGEARLVAYVVGAEQVEVLELRRYLEQRVPGYMIPAQFVVLEALPLTPNGKVDRKALPAPEGVRLAVAEYVAPRTETEEALAEIWRELLGVKEIGVHDNFFDLGGHSLLATQLMARVRERFAVEVALRRLFESPSIAGLSVSIVQSHVEQIDSAEVEKILAELEESPDLELLPIPVIQ